MMNLLIGLVSITSISLHAATNMKCNGFIDRKLNDDVRVYVNFEPCQFETSNECITELEYDASNECGGSGEEQWCTQAQGIGLLEVKLVKSGRMIRIKEILSSKDFELSDIRRSINKIKKKLTFKTKRNNILFKHGILRSKMQCF